MRYIVYTDGAGSTEKNVAGCSYLILTETKVCTRLKRHGATSLPNRKKS